MTNIKKILDFLQIKHIYLIFLFFSLIISVFYSYHLTIRFPNLIDDNFNLVVKNIPFAYGDLIHNLIYNNEYSTDRWGFKMYLSRLPILPFLIYILYQISANIYFIVIMKNLFFFSLFFSAAYFFIKTNKINIKFFILLIVIFFYNPYNLIVFSSFLYADFLTAILVPCLFLTILSSYRIRWLVFSILIFILYLSKTNMFFLTFFLSLIFYLLEKCNKKIIPLISLIIAISVWGTFGYLKTGKFPIAQSLITINSWGMSHVLNKEFKNYYPYKSVDQINFEDKNKTFSDEWQFYNFYNNKNKKYLNDNKIEYLKDIKIKLKFIFIDFYASASETYSNDGSKKIRFSNIPNKIFFNISLIIFLVSFIKSIKNRKFSKIDIYFIFFVMSYIFPLLIGWATCKHLIGIFLVSKIYLIFKFCEKYKYIN